MRLIKVFVDSDVLISSLISQSGAANMLVQQRTDLKLFISNLSVTECIRVANRLGLEEAKLKKLIEDRLNVIDLGKENQDIKTGYQKYTYDPNDAHIVAGGDKAKASFLISYNIRHFKADKIKSELGIIILKPANLLQYLRSLR